MASEVNETTQPWVLQLCHGYDGPFLDCARQYAVLFKETSYRVCTVYLTGEPNQDVITGSASDEVVFLNFSSRGIRGLKLEAISRVRKIIRSRNFELCIAHRFKPTYVAALASTHLPTIGVQHAFGVYKRRSRQLFARFFRKRLLLLGVSDAVRNDVRNCLPSWPPERIQTLYNRIDVKALQAQQVSRDEARRFFGIPESAWVVGNVGRLHPDKDQNTLIHGFAEALPALPDNALLLIIGTGRLGEDLLDLARSLGVEKRVVFAGHVSHASRYFKAFDVFALSSVNEGFGMVLAEAMAAGVPIVSSDSKAGREIVADVGVLFPVKDKRGLAEALTLAGKLSEEEKAAKAQAGYTKLRKCFSDDAAKYRFHELILPALMKNAEK